VPGKRGKLGAAVAAAVLLLGIETEETALGKMHECGFGK
jgi:hypothetical protein